MAREDAYVDTEIAALAARQHGVVARRQLRHLGLPATAVDYRIRTGRLHPIQRGVYTVGHRLVTIEGRRLAAVLACGDDAVLSHLDAGAAWALVNGRAGPIDVTVQRRSTAGPSGVRLHCVRVLSPDDVTGRDGIPITTVARTLVDLAEILDVRRLLHAVEAAERARIFDLRALERAMDRARGRHGQKRLRAVLTDYAGASEARPGLERAFVELCDRAGIPRPAMNVSVAGHTVDAYWPNERLVVEIDDRWSHATRKAFEEDRVRDADLQLAGQRVVRVTRRGIERQTGRVATTLTALLSQAGTPSRLSA